jgi:hypothetical protein
MKKKKNKKKQKKKKKKKKKKDKKIKQLNLQWLGSPEKYGKLSLNSPF